MAIDATTVEGMRVAGEEMTTTVGQTRSTAQNTEATVDSLMTTYTGTSATAFNSAVAAWGQNAEMIAKAMEALIQRMSDARATYAAAHQDTTDTATKLTSTIQAAPGLVLS